MKRRKDASPFSPIVTLSPNASADRTKALDPAVSSKDGHRKSNLKNKGEPSVSNHGLKSSKGKRCEHSREKSKCKQCGGGSICEHGRRKTECRQCGGSSICEHGRIKSQCKQCGGASICEHGRIKYSCKECLARPKPL